MASISAHSALHDALQALAPPQRRSVVAFANQLKEKNRAAKPRLNFDIRDLLSGLTATQIESATQFAMKLLKKDRSAAYLKGLKLMELMSVLTILQKQSFANYAGRLAKENKSASRAQEATLEEILGVLTVDQRDAVHQYAIALIPSGRIDVVSEILWVTRTLSAAQKQAVIERAKHLMTERSRRKVSIDPKIEEVLVLLSPSRHGSILHFARQFLTFNAVHKNKNLKLDNPDYKPERFPRWMTVQGGLANGK